MTPSSIVIVDVDAGMVPADVAAAAVALTRQVREHFSPLWDGLGASVTVRAATPDAPAGDGEWVLELRKVPTVDGALGFHDETDGGLPMLHVFPALCAADGASWTSCASHEILEALADPLLTWCSQSPTDGKIWALEVCDAVEALTYKIDGVDVSDFVTPEYFSPPKNLDGVKLDYMGSVAQPFQILEGGYGQTYDASTGWTQQGRRSKYRQFVADLNLHRSRAA